MFQLVIKHEYQIHVWMEDISSFICMLWRVVVSRMDVMHKHETADLAQNGVSKPTILNKYGYVVIARCHADETEASKFPRLSQQPTMENG